MRVLVTGGAGFIGSHLADALAQRGDEVRVLDSLESQVHPGPPSYLNSRVTYLFQDIRGPGVLENALNDVDVVYHLAAAVGVGQSMYKIDSYVDANVRGTGLLLQRIINENHRPGKLILASSMSIYGEGTYRCAKHGVISPSLRPPGQLAARDWNLHCPDCGTTLQPTATPEQGPLNPNSVYAITKRDQEELCLTVGRAYNLPTVALRFFNVYGPRQSLNNPYTGVAAIFQSRIKNNQPPVVFEDGLQTRDFVSVHDVVRALLLAASSKEANYEAINVGSGVPTSIKVVATELIRLLGGKLEPSIPGKYRAGDVRHCFANIDKAKRLLGYEPRTTLGQGMKELVSWGGSVAASDHFDDALEELRTRGLVEG